MASRSSQWREGGCVLCMGLAEGFFYEGIAVLAGSQRCGFPVDQCGRLRQRLCRRLAAVPRGALLASYFIRCASTMARNLSFVLFEEMSARYCRHMPILGRVYALALG